MLFRRRYRILRRLGVGGGGSVFEVEDSLYGGAPVALKALWVDDRERPSLTRALRSEFRVLASIKHPRLCRVHDFGRIPPGSEFPGDGDGGHGGGYFFTRDLVVGRDLRDAAQGRSVGEICALLADAARSLDVLHSAGLRHGDFKPANAIADDHGAVRLIDFGLSVGESTHRSAGTLAYLAPEILSANTVDRRADLYALGITLFELCTGAFPFADARGSALIDWHIRGVRPPISSQRLEAGPSVDALAMRLMDPDPDHRPPTALEVCAALERCAREHGAEVIVSGAEALAIPPIPMPQLAILERMFELRRKGQAGAVIELVGAEGSGKSTILTELAWRLELDGSEVLRGGARGAGRPFGALGAAFDQLESLTGIEQPVAPAGDAASAFAAPHAWAAWLARCSERWPIAIVLDDFDDADPGETALVRYLSHGIDPLAPVTIVVARRGEVVGDTPVTGAFQSVAVPPLSLARVEELVRLAGATDVPRLAARLHRVTDGNLLHLESWLIALKRRGFASAVLASDVPLPEGLEASARRLLASAEPARRAVMEVLSTVARAVPDAVVADIADAVGLAHSADALAATVASGVAVRDRAGRVAMARRSLAAYVRGQLEPDRARALHGAAARIVGAWAGLDSAHPERVLHQLHSGDEQVALTHGAEALARLRGAGDPAAALQLGDALVDALGNRRSERAEAVRLEVGELARLAGDAAQAARVLTPLLTSKRGHARSRAGLILGRAVEEAGEPERAEALWREVIDTASDSEHAHRAARHLARLFIKRGRNAMALEVVERFVDAGATLDMHLRMPRAYARGMLDLVDASEAEDVLLGIAGEAADTGALAVQATALNYAAILAQFKRGDFAATDARQRRALDAAMGAGDVVRAAGLRMNLASNAFHFGNYGVCLDELVASVSTLAAAGADTTRVMARRNLGHLVLELGEYEQAQAELEVAEGEAAGLGLDVHEAGCIALRGIAIHRAGDSAAGIGALEEALARFESLDSPRHVSETLLDLAEAHLRAGDPAAAVAAIAALDRASAIPATHDGLTRRARFHAAWAQLLARQGETARAQGHLDALAVAMEELRAQRGHHVLWELHRSAAAAQMALGHGDEAGRHRDAALAMLEAMAKGLPAAKRLTFWQDPRRRELRSVGTSESAPAFASTWMGSGDTVTDVSSSARYDRLLDIYRRMSSERDTERLLALVMETAIDLGGASRGFLLLADDGGQRLRTAVARNLPERTRAAMALIDGDPSGASLHDAPYSRTIAERVFRSGEVVASQDPRTDPRFHGAASVHSLGLGSVVCVPVHANGRIAGVLYLESPETRRHAPKTDLRLLMAFGDQVAILLDNARLNEENRRRADALAAANERIEELLTERTALLEKRTEELARTRRDLAAVRRRFLGDRGAYGLVGRSAAMERVFELIDRLAAADVPVLILGESGTGKELVARALHVSGPRSEAPMVSVNCGALPEQLLESELFGHERGAFTGADRMRRGLFETASGGTLFLDEVGETPPRMQATLLRALQEKVVRRVGGHEDIAVDVRIVAATNADLEKAVSEGRFREDLYYRLHVVPLHVPPLRERADDIPLLAEHFLSQAAERTGGPRRAITARAMRGLVDYRWPGNVRQLEHAITNAAVLADGAELDVADFGVLAHARERPVPVVVSADDRRASERARIINALEQAGWNKSKAARMLQIPRRTFYRRLQEYEIR